MLSFNKWRSLSWVGDLAVNVKRYRTAWCCEANKVSSGKVEDEELKAEFSLFPSLTKKASGEKCL